MSPIFGQMMPGMEWILLMLLALSVGLFAGALGILVGLAVSKSQFALWAGAFACVVGVGSPLFFLLVAGRNLTPDAYPLLASPLLPGLLAVLLSSRPSVRWLAENEERPAPEPGQRAQPALVANRPVRVTLVLTCALVAVIVFFVNWQRPRREFERLLAGDGQVEVTSVLITGQGRKVLLSDPASARYLTDAFRSAQTHPPGLGTTYIAEVRLAGGSVEVALYIPDESGWVAMSWPLDSWEGATYYWLRLPEPMPGPVTEALRQLR